MPHGAVLCLVCEKPINLETDDYLGTALSFTRRGGRLPVPIPVGWHFRTDCDECYLCWLTRHYAIRHRACRPRLARASTDTLWIEWRRASSDARQDI